MSGWGRKDDAVKMMMMTVMGMEIVEMAVIPSFRLVHGANPAAPLDARRSPARAVGKRGHGLRLVPERGLERPRDRSRVLQVEEMDVALGGGDDEQPRFRIHRVDAVVTGDGGERVALPQVPEANRLVPGPGRDDRHAVRAGDLDEAHAADGGVVRADGGLLPRRCVQDVALLVDACSDDHGPVLFSVNTHSAIPHA